MVLDRYIKKVITYSRKFPSASDSLIEQMVKRQFSEQELSEIDKTPDGRR